ncbi:diketogulonate reductase-like aldo/keto reductase [Pedobacter sp. W3I1]|nr:diketogulonate reductase-like aldo/keto reductase [Pedobacter sp. W3I1]
MNENFNVFDFELSAGDLTAINSLDQDSGLIRVFKKWLKI